MPHLCYHAAIEFSMARIWQRSRSEKNFSPGTWCSNSTLTLLTSLALSWDKTTGAVAFNARRSSTRRLSILLRTTFAFALVITAPSRLDWSCTSPVPAAHPLRFYNDKHDIDQPVEALHGRSLAARSNK